MKKIIFTLLAAALVFIGCNKEDAVEEPVLSGKTIELIGVMPEVTAPAGTRVEFDYTDGGQSVPLNAIIFKWEVGDKVQLCYKQGTNIYNGDLIVGTVTLVEDNGKTCYFNLPIPTGLDTNAPYTIYGAAGGTQAGGAKFVTNSTEIESISSVGDQYFNLTTAKENAILVFKKEMPAGTSTRVEFNHIGAFLALRIFNTSTTSETLNLSEALLESTSDWYYGGTLNYDVATGVANATPQKIAKVKPATPMNLAPTNNSGLLWQWVVPFAAPTQDLKLKVGNQTMDMPANTLVPGRYYRISRNWAGVFGGVYATKFCTNQPAQEGDVKIKVTFGQAGAWVDMNRTGFQDSTPAPADIVATNGGNYDLHLPANPRPYCYTIYGELTGLKLTGNKQNVIISAVTNSPYVEKLELSENTIGYAALYELVKDLPDRTGKTMGLINLRNNVPNFNITNFKLTSGTHMTEINAFLTQKNWGLVEQNPDIITG